MDAFKVLAAKQAAVAEQHKKEAMQLFRDAIAGLLAKIRVVSDTIKETQTKADEQLATARQAISEARTTLDDPENEFRTLSEEIITSGSFDAKDVSEMRAARDDALLQLAALSSANDNNEEKNTLLGLLQTSKVELTAAKAKIDVITKDFTLKLAEAQLEQKKLVEDMANLSGAETAKEAAITAEAKARQDNARREFVAQITAQKKTIEELTNEVGVLKDRLRLEIKANESGRKDLELAEKKLGEAGKELAEATARARATASTDPRTERPKSADERKRNEANPRRENEPKPDSGARGRPSSVTSSSSRDRQPPRIILNNRPRRPEPERDPDRDRDRDRDRGRGRGQGSGRTELGQHPAMKRKETARPAERPAKKPKTDPATTPCHYGQECKSLVTGCLYIHSQEEYDFAWEKAKAVHESRRNKRAATHEDVQPPEFEQAPSPGLPANQATVMEAINAEGSDDDDPRDRDPRDDEPSYSPRNDHPGDADEADRTPDVNRGKNRGDDDFSA
jgi:hypothetical protein